MLATSALAAGCADILGFPDYTSAKGTGGGATGGSGGTATGGSGTTSGSTTTASSSSTTSSATGGSGGAAPMACEPGTSAPCYSGAPETIGVGPCKQGTKTCEADGASYGPCVGEIAPAVEQCGTPSVDESCDGIATCTGQIRWGRAFGDAASQSASAIAASKDGRVAIAGAAQGTVDFGGGATTGGADDDAYVAVYGPLGQYVWSKRLGDSAIQRGAAVAFDPTGSVVVGGTIAGTADFGDGAPRTATGTDGFVAKYDANGALLWAKVLGDAGADASVRAVASSDDGSTFVAGTYTGSMAIQGCPLPVVAAQSDAFVARFDPGGACAWLVGFGASSDEFAEAIALDASGSVLVAGTYASASISVGGTVLTNAGGADAFVVKLDATDGAALWARSFNGASEQSPLSISSAKASTDVFVLGRSIGATDFGDGKSATAVGIDAWLVRLDKDGKTIDLAAFGGTANDYGQALAVDDAGQPIVGVNSNGPISFNQPYTGQGGFDAYVVKLDATTLQPIWSKQIGAAADQSLFGLATDGTGRVFVAGTHTGPVDLGGVQIGSQGGSDAFVVGLAP
jgi:hypothetical protein